MEISLDLDLPEDDIAFIDAYVASNGLASRSAALRAAVELLRARVAQPDDVREGGGHLER
ncbi:MULTISPECIES: hypothetical protein [unclassified Streptomyces]|uniref:hypothetical protein n=1 Tax=unclassified Streptomyces TaxID=2593676 RepID=UPI0022521AD9|nr:MULTISPECIES: hypothetical protein [unclassified Streptomyces]MCX4832556.1 hypothetical protein [Streptomyces sp. NBC_01016]